MAEGGVWGPGAGRMPRLVASLPCEDAAVSFGVGDARVTLQRVFLDVGADGFPAGCDRLVVVNLWTGGEGSYSTAVRLVGPDGEEVARVDGGAMEARPSVPTNAQVHDFGFVVLPVAGVYALEVLLDDALVQSYPLWVAPLGAGEEPDGQA
jgi:hypothetical protein